MIYNIYCDESCHLSHDDSDVMVLGCINMPAESKKKITDSIKQIKIKHSLSPFAEIKWTKVSPTKLQYYVDLINFFFDSNELTFRGLVALGKKTLDHRKYNDDDYDLWYYKMYFYLLNKQINPPNQYRIFIDIKDTKGGPRVRKLKEVLCNNIYDYKNEILQDIHQIRSHESDVMGIVDLLIGAMSYSNRTHDDSFSSSAKMQLIKLIEDKSGYNVNSTTPYQESKFNIFRWEGRNGSAI